MSNYAKTLSHAVETQGDFSERSADGYVLLYHQPCFHLARFRSGRLDRFLRLTRSNLRLAFGRERGDRTMDLVGAGRRRFR
jgi:hypothetical protein